MEEKENVIVEKEKWYQWPWPYQEVKNEVSDDTENGQIANVNDFLAASQSYAAQ